MPELLPKVAVTISQTLDVPVVSMMQVAASAYSLSEANDDASMMLALLVSVAPAQPAASHVEILRELADEVEDLLFPDLEEHV